MEKKKKATKKLQEAPSKHDAYGEATYHQILQVATKLFAEKGFDGVTTKEICDQAKANISSLHYHFETKNKLFLKIIESLGTSFHEVTTHFLTPPQTKDEMKIRLELYLSESLSIFDSRVYLHRIIFREMGLATDRSFEIIKHFAPIIETIKTFFHEAKKNRLFDEKVDPDFAAFYFLKQLQLDFDPHHFKQKYFNIEIKSPEGKQKFVKNTIHHFLEGFIQR